MEGQRHKRQKVALACEPCRSRKIKCDGREPVCEPCNKRPGGATACTRDNSSGRLSARLPSDELRWLDDRIRQLENNSMHIHTTQPSDGLVAVGKSQNATNQTATTTRHIHSNSSEHHVTALSYNACFPTTETRRSPYPQSLNSASYTSIKMNSQPQKDFSGTDEVPTSNDVHAIIGAPLDEHHREGFFGYSSAGTFMQNVRKMVEQKLDGPQQSTPQVCREDCDNSPPMVPGHRLRQQKIDYVLPPRKKADGLLLSYWKHSHCLYPYLDKVQVQEDYDKIWRGDDSVSEERSFLCLLNIIFALSSQIDESTPPEQRESSATVFYLRAAELLDVVETGSVRSVQVFLLLGQYFQSTNKPHPCWVFVGLGIRTAQSLGLHLPETSERVYDKNIREMLRRVWHGCVLMDRVLSMTYGRPCMIGPRAAKAVPLPTTMDNEILLPESDRQHTSQIQKTSIVEFYIQSLTLYEILHDVVFNLCSIHLRQSQPIDTLYEKYFGNPTSIEEYPSVLQLEQRLSKWENDLPAHLKTRKHLHDDSSEILFQRQAVVLHQRVLHVRLLLLRPILSNFIVSELQPEQPSIPSRSLLARRIFLQCAIVCVKVAQEAIDTIYEKRPARIGHVGLISSWWYNVLFLYTSATILIAARLSSSILVEVPEESILASWRKAIEVLEEYGVFETSIPRLTTTLCLLFKAVPQQYSRLRQNPRQTEADSAISSNTQGEAASVSAQMGSGKLTDFQPLATYARNDDLNQESTNFFVDGALLEFDSVFDTAFDPNDLTWLMTMPLDA